MNSAPTLVAAALGIVFGIQPANAHVSDSHVGGFAAAFAHPHLTPEHIFLMAVTGLFVLWAIRQFRP